MRLSIHSSRVVFAHYLLPTSICRTIALRIYCVGCDEGKSEILANISPTFYLRGLRGPEYYNVLSVLG